jgi:hypothetical protein
MPEYDGTGPRGRGPLTGAGRGFCILKLPRARGEAMGGLAGWAGKPVRLDPGYQPADGPDPTAMGNKTADGEQGLRRRTRCGFGCDCMRGRGKP